MGSVGIAYDEVDEATAKAVAARLGRQGEDVKLITSSDELNGLDRVIILWSRASLHSRQLYDIWRLFVRTQHAIIGDVSPDELPEQVPPDFTLVITKNHDLLERSQQRRSAMPRDLC